MAGTNPFDGILERAHRSPDYWEEVARVRFADDLADLMRERRLSRSDLAEAIGCSRPYVTKLLSGNANLTIGSMVRALMAFERLPLIKPVLPAEYWGDVYLRVPMPPVDMRQDQAESMKISLAHEISAERSVAA